MGQAGGILSGIIFIRLRNVTGNPSPEWGVYFLISNSFNIDINLNAKLNSVNNRMSAVLSLFVSLN